jgi:hypothetical protein
MEDFYHRHLEPLHTTQNNQPFNSLLPPPLHPVLNVRPPTIASLSPLSAPSTSLAMTSGSASIDLEIVSLKNRLYDACVPFANIVFNQTILFGLDIVKDGDLNTLLTVTQGLVDDKLFKVVHAEGLGWKLRTRDEARKLEPPLALDIHICDDIKSTG